MPHSWKAMKGEAMKFFYRWFLLSFVVSCFLAAPADSQDKFKLKPGATGKACLGCHVNFQDKLKSAFVHTPVKTGDCTGCHSPHAASFGKLLAADPNKICDRCHKTMIPEKARSTHKVVLEGNCAKCHDPHAANNKFN